MAGPVDGVSGVRGALAVGATEDGPVDEGQESVGAVTHDAPNLFDAGPQTVAARHSPPIYPFHRLREGAFYLPVAATLPAAIFATRFLETRADPSAWMLLGAAYLAVSIVSLREMSPGVRQASRWIADRLKVVSDQQQRDSVLMLLDGLIAANPTKTPYRLKLAALTDSVRYYAARGDHEAAADFHLKIARFMGEMAQTALERKRRRLARELELSSVRSFWNSHKGLEAALAVHKRGSARYTALEQSLGISAERLFLATARLARHFPSDETVKAAAGALKIFSDRLPARAASTNAYSTLASLWQLLLEQEQKRRSLDGDRVRYLQERVSKATPPV